MIGVPPGVIGHIGGAGATWTIAATLAGSAWAQAPPARRPRASSLRPSEKRPSSTPNLVRASTMTCSRPPLDLARGELGRTEAGDHTHPRDQLGDLRLGVRVALDVQPLGRRQLAAGGRRGGGGVAAAGL